MRLVFRIDQSGDDRFSGVLKASEKNCEEYAEVGACFAATVEGEYVVDIWAGHMDVARTDAPVVRYWPEFGAEGKESVLVRHLLSYSAACVDLAGQATWSETGTQSGYHAITQSHLIGEVIRRITGKSFGTFFREEVAEKVGADFHIGVDPQHHHRIADVLQDQRSAALDEVNAFLDMNPESITARVLDGLDITEDEMSPTGWQQPEIPAANGHGNARSVVRAQTARANGGKAFGVELLSPGGCQRAPEPQTDGMDLIMGLPITDCLGYARKSNIVRFGSDEGTIFWGGAGGSTIVLDTEAHVCLSYVMHQMCNDVLGDQRSNNLGLAPYERLLGVMPSRP